MGCAPGARTTLVRFISCRNDAGVRLAARLLTRRADGHIALVEDDGERPDVAVILCPPDCDV
jgi:hypothetical protein